MASPLGVDITFNVNKAMDTVGAWVAALVARIEASGDARTKKIVPRLAAKLAVQAGLNAAFAEELEENPFHQGRAEGKLRELQKGMKEIVELLNSVDPQFGGANVDLLASLTASINLKEKFLWKAQNGNLFEDAFRNTVAVGMHSQAEKLKEAAKSLSAAAGLEAGRTSSQT